jgi:hypothetical protein
MVRLTDNLYRQRHTSGNLAMFQSVLLSPEARELQPVLLSITFGAWWQVEVVKKRLGEGREGYR